MSYDHLTGRELDDAHAAADHLLARRELLNMDPSLAAELDTLRADLTVEQEDRRKLARS